MPPEDPFPGIPKTFAEQYFWSLDVEDRDPLPKELKFLKLFGDPDGCLPHLQELMAEVAGACEKHVPSPDLWEFLTRASGELKLAAEWAQRRIKYFEQRAADKSALEAFEAGTFLAVSPDVKAAAIARLRERRAAREKKPDGPA